MEWRVINASCTNCGQPLEARPIHNTSIIIIGNEPMIYRHKGGREECPPSITKARPYSNWGKFDGWKANQGD